MLTEYIHAALATATYEILPDNEGFYGKVPKLIGVWANANTLEECREELREVLEEWIILSLKTGKPIPEIHGVNIDVDQEAA